MKLKAEVVLGFQLVSRHRAPRLAAALTLVLAVAMSLARSSASTPACPPLVLSLVGGLSAIACSRPLAHGAALGSARLAAAPGWMVAGGRFIGAMLFIAPLVLFISVVTGHTTFGFAIWRAEVYAGAIGMTTVGLSPLVGASAASGIGLGLVALGVMGSPLTVAAVPWLDQMFAPARHLEPSFGVAGMVLSSAVGLGLAAWAVSRRRSPGA